jgi:hypothetical protein
VDEREMTALGWRLRRTLSTLDEIGVPLLSELTAPRRPALWRVLVAPIGAVAVLAAALVVGAGLAAWRQAITGSGAGAQPASSAPVVVDAATLPAPRYLDIAGYRFTVTVVADPRYSRAAAASPAYVSGVQGIGVRCAWDRLGTALDYADGLFGTTDAVSSLARYSPLTTGAHADSVHGIPTAASQSAVVVCGVTDRNGAHGVIANIGLSTDARAPIRSLGVFPWSGVVGDASAVSPCTGKAGDAALIAAFASTADEIASWIENSAYPDAPQNRDSVFRTQYAPSAPIYVCYYAGRWSPPVAPPGPGLTAEPLIYDRARYFVDASGTLLYPQSIAPSDRMPLVRPGGRF